MVLCRLRRALKATSGALRPLRPRVPLQRPSLDVALRAACGRSNSIPSNLSLLVQGQFCQEQNWTRFSVPVRVRARDGADHKSPRESTFTPIWPCPAVTPAQQYHCIRPPQEERGKQWLLAWARQRGLRTSFAKPRWRSHPVGERASRKGRSRAQRGTEGIRCVRIRDRDVPYAHLLRPT